MNELHQKLRSRLGAYLEFNAAQDQSATRKMASKEKNMTTGIRAHDLVPMTPA
jgi:membrane protein required for beta-lactamase induction